MRVFITGFSGQLGYDVAKVLESRGIDYKGVSSKDLDITDASAVDDMLTSYRPDAVIHCAAFTKVDLAESVPERCWAVNVDGTRNIAASCRKLGCKMVYISTDYVFPGDGTEPYLPDDDANPQSVYGASKYAGELAVRCLLDKFFIVRISWVFGINGSNFIKTMLRIGSTHNEVRVVNDQIGSPTYTADLAPLLCDMVMTEKYGIYHATNEGDFISWYDFTREIYRQAGYATKVLPVTTAEYGLNAAKRPSNSRMCKTKLAENGFSLLPPWQNALSRYLGQLNSQE